MELEIKAKRMHAQISEARTLLVLVHMHACACASTLHSLLDKNQ